VALLALIVACTSTVAEPPPTATPPVPPTAADGASPSASASPAPTSAVRQRWGHDPFLPTGEFDAPWNYKPLPPGYRVEAVDTSLDLPAQLAATPDGRLLIAQQLGSVRVVQDGRILDDPFITIDVYTPEDQIAEHGLVGIAVDPDFEENHYVYLYYTADNPRRIAIARVRDENNRGVGLEEIFTYEAESPCCHVGGGMKFGPDGHLFVGVGEHTGAKEAQDPTNPLGSVLRLNKDGSSPPDNPFGGPVYAYGLRNAYDVAIDPATGRIFAGENGNWGQDAVVEVREGANYGWPGEGLRVAQGEVEPPLTFYHEALGISGMEFYSRNVLSEFTGRLYYCAYHQGGALHEVEFNGDGSVKAETIIALGCETDVATGADGFLYFLNYANGILYRIARDG
jgi:glucose/arabinose dehydrogenase